MIKEIVFGSVEFSQAKHMLFIAYYPRTLVSHILISKDIELFQSKRIENKTFRVIEFDLGSDWVFEIFKENLNSLDLSDKDTTALVLPDFDGICINIDYMNIFKGINAYKHIFNVYSNESLGKKLRLNGEAILRLVIQQEIEMLTFRVR